MDRLRSFLDRLVPALIAAGGVALLAAGLMTVLDPAAAQAEIEASPSVVATPTPSPSPRPSGSPTPSPEASPSPSGSPLPAVASRVVVPALKIDLPVVAQSFGPGKGAYPLCDVAQYLEIFGQPSEIGTTYLYGHAR